MNKMKHLICIFLALIIQVGNLYINLDNVMAIDSQTNRILIYFKDDNSNQIYAIYGEDRIEFLETLNKLKINDKQNRPAS